MVEETDVKNKPADGRPVATAPIYPSVGKIVEPNPAVADADLTAEDKPTIPTETSAASEATKTAGVEAAKNDAPKIVEQPAGTDTAIKINSNGKPQIAAEKNEKKKTAAGKLSGISISFGVSLPEKVFLAKHLSIILKSGISLPESLRIVAEQSKGKLKKVLNDIILKVESGKALNIALSDHKDVFDPLFVNMIKIGEKSGTLDQSLTYLAEQLSKDAKLVGKIKSASLYPTIVLVAATIVGGGISYFILPKLTKLFTSFGANLPLASRMLLWFSKSIEKYGLIWLAVIVALVIGVWLLLKIKAVKGIWQKIMLVIPILGRLTKSLNLARFSLTLGTLLKSSVTIDEALSITSDALNYIPYQKAIKIMKAEVSKGKTMLEGIEIADPKSRLFDPSTRAMIRVGEKTGSLNNSLLYISEFFQEEVDTITKDLATALEPILLIIIALIVGFIAVAIITPMYSILGVIGG